MRTVTHGSTPSRDVDGTSTAWTVVAVVVASGIVVALGLGKLIAALPAVRTDLGIGLTLGGALLAAFAVVSAAGGVGVGVVVDRVGAPRTLLAGLVLVLAGSLAGGTVASGGLLLATTAVEGAGYLAVVVAAPTIIARAARPADGGLALGIWGAYMPSGQALMAAAAPLLLAAWTWRALWFVHALLLLACAVVAWLALVRPRAGAATAVPARPGPRRGDLARALHSPAARVLTLAFGAYVVLFAVTGFLPTVYVDRGLGTTASTLLTGVVIVLNAVGNLAAGLLLRRGVRYGTVMAAGATVAGLAALGAVGPALPFGVAYACALVLAAASGLLPAAVLAAVPALAEDPDLVPVTNGMIVQAIGVGMVVGPLAYGALADALGGWHATPLVASGAAALALLLAVRVRRLERPAGTSDQA